MDHPTEHLFQTVRIASKVILPSKYCWSLKAAIRASLLGNTGAALQPQTLTFLIQCFVHSIMLAWSNCLIFSKK